MRRSVCSLGMGLCLVTTVLPGCRQAQIVVPSPEMAIATVPSQEPPLTAQMLPIASPEQAEPAKPLPIATLLGPEQPVRFLQTEEPVSRNPIAAAAAPPQPEPQPIAAAAAPPQPEPQPTQSPPVPRWPGAHQSDYLWLVGVLERGPEVGTWTLCYARPEEKDRYGGRLQLVASYPLAGYQPGQLLRVEGHVVVDSLQTAYHVKQIEVLPQDGPAMANPATPGR